MRILTIALKEIKQNLRDKKNLAIMTLFPIVLIVILGAAFSKVMGDSVDLGKIDVLYTIKTEGNVSTAFEGLKKDIDNLNVEFTKIDNIEEAKDSIKDSKYSAYVLIDDSSKEITLYKNERYDFNASIIQGILDTFKQSYNVIAEITLENPQVIPEIIKEDNSKYVTLEALDKKKQPRAIDYYGVTMTTLIILYASMTAAYGIKKEETLKTGNRMKVSPVTKGEVFAGKVLGFWLITVIEVAIVLLFSKYVIKVDWGNDMGVIFLILLSEIFIAVSIGVAVSYLTKSEGAMTGILNLLIPVMVFLGGGYVPLEQFNSGILTTLSKVSPMTWVNQSILNVIYANDFDKVMPAILINLGATLILLMVSSVAFRKGEV
jgi:ABC-2 type transport system permease protein